MLGKASTAILAMTVVLCCLAVMVNGANYEMNKMTKEDMIDLNKKLSEAKCNVTVNKADEVAIFDKCVKKENSAKQITQESFKNPETIKELGLTDAQWTTVKSCVNTEHGWDKIWVTQAEATKFIENSMKFANDATKTKFKDTIAKCITDNTADAAKTACGQKAVKEICLNIT